MEAERWQDLTLTMEQVLRESAKWFPFLTVPTFVPFLLLWGLPTEPLWARIGDGIGAILIWVLLAVAVYAVSAIVHELIHAAAMLLNGIPRSSIRFGARLRQGAIYVHTAHPMTARAYRAVLLAPGIFQGVLPILVGTVIGNFTLLLYGYVMLVSAVGDLTIFHLIRRVPAHAVVKDHPDSVGCRVLAEIQD